ncbi:MAG: histidine kinase [Bacteroidetes bacterium]|nr:histidine kinase [Bacteroidota bacterium]
MRYLILLFLVFSSCAQAQELLFEQFTTEEGLPSNNVYNLHQDKKGYIWVFTDEGTAKYNGHKFIPALTNIESGKPFIYCAFETKNGQMYVADSKSNLYAVRNDSAIRIEGLEKMSEQFRRLTTAIHRLYVDDSSNIYVISKYCAFKLIPSGKSFTPVALTKGSNRIDTLTIFHVGQDIIPALHWANIKSEKIVFTEPLSGKSLLINLNKNNDLPKHVKRLENQICFSTAGEFIKIDEQFMSLKRKRINGVIQNFYNDHQKHTWLCCYKDGLYKLADTNIVAHFLQGKTINDVLFDNQEGIWASSSGFGLYHAVNQACIQYKNSDFESGITLLKKVDSSIFIGTTLGTLFSFSNDHLKSIVLKSTTNQNSLFDLNKNNHHYFIPNMYSSCLRTDADFKHQKIVASNLSQIEKIILIDSNSAIITNVRSICTLSHGNFGERLISPYARIRDGCAYGRERRILLCTDKEMVSYKNGKFRLLSVDFACKKVKRCLHQIVVCSRNDELYFFDTLTEKPVSPAVFKDLPSVTIHDFASYHDSLFFICSNAGLFCKDLTSPAKAWKVVVPGDILNIAFSSNNDLLLNTYNSLLQLKYSVLCQKSPDIPMYLNKVLVNDLPVDSSSLNSLVYTQNNLEFFFDILDFHFRDKQIYYKLEGPVFDSSFISTPSIKFRSLPEGHYQLSVWPLSLTNRKFIIHFNLLPPFWRTGAFYAYLILFALFVMTAIILYTNARVRKKEKEKRNIEIALAEHKITALKAQINPHFMSNSLSSLQLLIMENKTTEALNYLARFSRLLRMILDVSDKTLVPLETEIALIRLNIELEGLRFTQNFTYEIEVDPAIDPANTFIPPLIEQPVIENAIWHGLIPSKRSDKKLHISFRKINNSIQIQIENNGIGYVEPVPQKNESKGLKITRERLHQINRMYPEFETFFNIKKSQTSGSDSGTQVIFVLPLILVYDSNY